MDELQYLIFQPNVDHLYRPLTLRHTPFKQTRFMNAPLRHLAVTMTKIVITRSEFIAHVMATPVYVIKAGKRVLVIVVIMLPRKITAGGHGKGATGTLGDQAVNVLKRAPKENVSGLSFEENINVMCLGLNPYRI